MYQLFHNHKYNLHYIALLLSLFGHYIIILYMVHVYNKNIFHFFYISSINNFCSRTKMTVTIIMLSFFPSFPYMENIMRFYATIIINTKIKRGDDSKESNILLKSVFLIKKNKTKWAIPINVTIDISIINMIFLSPILSKKSIYN